MATIFSKIISGEIPCYKIAESEKFLAFLDIQPVAKGHALVVPKIEVDFFFDLDEDYLQEINLFARDIAKKMKKVIPCKRIGVAIIGLEVPHAHVHLIPMNTIGDMNFTNPRLQFSTEEYQSLAKSISEA
ncbi:MAG: HIT family protein [Flavobacteriales bacterium]|nr:HIT family protein [Flavobacteriales bacterium]